MLILDDIVNGERPAEMTWFAGRERTSTRGNIGERVTAGLVDVSYILPAEMTLPLRSMPWMFYKHTSQSEFETAA